MVYLPSRPVFNDITVVQHLAGALSEAKAREVVDAALASLGYSRGPLSHEQMLEVLEAIAASPGIVGISARFVKSRLILQVRK